MSSNELKVRLNSDNYLRVWGIYLVSDGSVPDVSTAKAELRNTAGGSAITDSDIDLSQVSGRSDEYEGEFPNSVSLTAGDEVWVWVQVIDSNNRQGEEEHQTTVVRA